MGTSGGTTQTSHPPGEIEYSPETAFELLIEETRLYVTAKDNGIAHHGIHT
jgi:hypothetical protein